MKHLGLFEGIGGFSLAARWIGWKTVAWCEINPFCQTVLKYQFPNAEAHSDIKETDFKKYANKIDIVTGGFPCQPYSTAGKRKGKDDDRHFWPEMLRAIREIRPSYVVGENVRGLTNWNGGLVFDEVQADLETEGYEVLPFLLPACAVNAPHRRDRIWFIAYSIGNGYCNGFTKTECAQKEIERKEQWSEWNEIFGQWHGYDTWRITSAPTSTYSEKSNEQRDRICKPNSQVSIRRCDCLQNASNAHISERQESGMHTNRSEETERYTSPCFAWASGRPWQNFPTQSPVCGGDDGLPRELDGITFSKWRNESLKAYGNAIVPQVALEIFKVIDRLKINHSG